MSEEKRMQVAAQCSVVNHLATAIARVHGDYTKIFQSGAADNLIDQVGARTAAFMEDLGDMLNGMDAATEDDKWTVPIFREAQRLWPRSK